MTENPVRAALEQIHPDAAEVLSTAGFEVDMVDRALDEDRLIDRLAGVTLLGIRSKTHVTARVLDAAPELIAVGAFCIGTNQIDLRSAVKHGVTVFNAPFSNTRSVVELVIAEIVVHPPAHAPISAISDSGRRAGSSAVQPSCRCGSEGRSGYVNSETKETTHARTPRRLHHLPRRLRVGGGVAGVVGSARP